MEMEMERVGKLEVRGYGHACDHCGMEGQMKALDQLVACRLLFHRQRQWQVGSVMEACLHRSCLLYCLPFHLLHVWEPVVEHP